MDEATESGIVFGNLVPLPYKVIFGLQLGVFLWYLLVRYCYENQKLNILSLLNLSYSNHNYSHLDGLIQASATGEYSTANPADVKENLVLIRGIKASLKKLATINLISYLIYVLIGLKKDQNVILYPIHVMLPYITIGYGFQRLFWYSRKKETFGQYRMYTTVKRILMGRINSQTMRTNDILISDSLTSYSKVLNDLSLFVWSTFSNEVYNSKIEFIVLAIPGLIRMKQCWFEYKLTKQKQHLFNFLKYFSGLVPILINLLIKLRLLKLNPENSQDISQTQLLESLKWLNTCWYFASIVNSTYSFIWDVRMDWGFQLFEPIFKSETTFIPLRPWNQLVYKNMIGYHSIIMTDFVLRFLWVFKIFIIKDQQNLTVFNHLGQFLFGNDVYSFGYTIVEILEIFRRWLWCFLKLESDWVKLQKIETINNSLPNENIEMNSFKNG